MASKLVGWRLFLPLYKPIISLQDRFPVLRHLVGYAMNYFPHAPTREVKKIIDTMHNTSRRIYEEKKSRILNGGDDEAKMNVLDGRDLMSVMRTFARSCQWSHAYTDTPSILYPHSTSEHGGCRGGQASGRRDHSTDVVGSAPCEDGPTLLNITRTFTFAGTDTTSNALARIFHLLCMHPESQEKLRKEILDARGGHSGHDLPYDDLVELPYFLCPRL